jgi:hypothetical protein
MNIASNEALPRPVATDPDEVRQRYTLPLAEVATRFEAAGFPRSTRSLQRYCGAGKLDCLKEITPTGDAYFVDAQSVARAIAELRQLYGAAGAVRQDATERDVSRPVAVETVTLFGDDKGRRGATADDAPTTPSLENQGATESAMSRHVATDRDMTERYIARLEAENEFLRSEATTKNAQIKELTERARETNLLVAGLQKMLTPLLGGGEGRGDKSEASIREAV